MSNSLDFHILPILRQEGQTLPDIPGLHIAKPPRRADRRRASEQLIFHLTLQGNAPLSADAYQQLLRGLVGVYYKTPGSATAAMQKVTEALNNYLRDRNMRGASRGLRAVGVFTQIVIRSNTAYIAQSGPSHLFVVKPGQAVEYHDIQMSGRGLGMSRVPKVRFHHETLTENDLLLITPAPPPIWSTATLKNLSRMQMKSRYHRLLHRLEEDVNAILVMPQAGSGEVRILRPKLGEETKVGADAPAPAGAPQPEGEGAAPLAAIRDKLGKTSLVSAPQPPGAAQPPGCQPPPVAEPPQPAPRTPAPSAAPISQSPEVEREPRRSALLEKIRQLPIGMILGKIGALLGTLGRAIRNALGGISASISTLVRRTLPDEAMLDFPSWVPGLIAVAVPIVMVVIGSVVYAEKKGGDVFNEHYGLARSQVEQAQNTEDAAEQYQALRSASENLEIAHVYNYTDESKALYEQVMNELDTLDKVTRLYYESLISLDEENVKISEIVVDSYGDLYLLNETTGKVIRLVNNNGYEKDDDFSCGPVPLEHKEVDKLVDIVLLAPNRPDGAVILGIDASHTMILCTQEGGASNSIFEDTSYNLPKGTVKAMTISSGDLGDIFILAPGEQLVLVEYVMEDYRTGAEYFGEGDSTPMTDAIDLAASGGQLYLLHDDGHITRCVKQGQTISPQCESPFEFSDARLGLDSVPSLEGANFSALKYKTKFGMMLYLLDPAQQAIYYFNPQLEYQGQIRPPRGFSGEAATAFAVYMHKEIYLAVGGEVYRAKMGGR